MERVERIRPVVQTGLGRLGHARDAAQLAGQRHERTDRHRRRHRVRLVPHPLELRAQVVPTRGDLLAERGLPPPMLLLFLGWFLNRNGDGSLVVAVCHGPSVAGRGPTVLPACASEGPGALHDREPGPPPAYAERPCRGSRSTQWSPPWSTRASSACGWSPPARLRS